MKKTLSVLLASLFAASLIGCNSNIGHQHDYSVKSMDDEYLAAAEGCLAGRLYFYACSVCGEAGEYVWAAGDSLGHNLTPDGCSRCDWVSIDSGTLSSGQQWAYYSDGSLHFFGNGALPDWTEEQLLGSQIPWMAYPVRSVVIPKGINSIGDRSFAGLTRLTSVTMPYGITTMGESAFEGCVSLTDPTLPETLNTIGKNAFRGCTSIQNITLPRFTVFMEGNAFAGCSALETLTVAPGNTAFTMNNGCLIENSTGTVVAGIKTAVIPTDGSVKVIGEAAFEGCVGLSAIHIPASVVTIESGAFYGCSGVNSITVDLTNIAYLSSGNCLIERATKKLIQGCNTSVLPADGSVEEISDLAFAYCSGLKTVYLPSSITNISSSAFIGCSGIESIAAAEGNTHYSSQGNCLIITGTRTLQLGCKTSIIPEDGSVVRIGNGAFAGTSITEMTIPDVITSIGEGAFENCKELTKITFGKGITTLSGESFTGCNALETIAVAEDHPNLVIDLFSLVDKNTGTLLLGTNKSEVNRDGLVTSIGAYAYAGRTEIGSFFIPKHVTSIGEGAFYGCSSLSIFWYTGSQEEWAQVSLGNGWSAFTAFTGEPNCNATE